VSAPDLAFKAYEIEEFIDIHFYRRVGIVLAHAARLLGLSPNAVSVLAGIVGGIGGALLVADRYVWLGLALTVLFGAMDSADGQLARMTGRTSEFGRLLDGLAGYVQTGAAYIALVIRMVHGGDPLWWALALGALGGIATAIHAQMYDYHRTAYAAIVLKGRAASPDFDAHAVDRRSGLVKFYEGLQRRLSGGHAAVEQAVAASADAGVVPPLERQRYRHCFYRPVRWWNLFGDNVRRYALIALAALGHLDWYFAFILVPLNLLLVAVWLYQQNADRRFLRGIDPGGKRT
jgi:phosphatidylglycerophosphate synthase